MAEQDYRLKRTHHGKNLKRIRQRLGIKKEQLATDMNLDEETISAYESKEVIEDDMLEKFALALNVPVDAIKELEESPVRVFIENNTFEKSNANVGNIIDIHEQANKISPIDEILQLAKENKALYERMIKIEEDRNAELKKLLDGKK